MSVYVCEGERVSPCVGCRSFSRDRDVRRTEGPVPWDTGVEETSPPESFRGPGSAVENVTSHDTSGKGPGQRLGLVLIQVLPSVVVLWRLRPVGSTPLSLPSKKGR